MCRSWLKRAFSSDTMCWFWVSPIRSTVPTANPPPVWKDETVLNEAFLSLQSRKKLVSQQAAAFLKGRKSQVMETMIAVFLRVPGSCFSVTTAALFHIVTLVILRLTSLKHKCWAFMPTFITTWSWITHKKTNYVDKSSFLWSYLPPPNIILIQSSSYLFLRLVFTSWHSNDLPTEWLPQQCLGGSKWSLFKCVDVAKLAGATISRLNGCTVKSEGGGRNQNQGIIKSVDLNAFSNLQTSKKLVLGHNNVHILKIIEGGGSRNERTTVLWAVSHWGASCVDTLIHLQQHRRVCRCVCRCSAPSDLWELPWVCTLLAGHRFISFKQSNCNTPQIYLLCEC